MTVRRKRGELQVVLLHVLQQAQPDRGHAGRHGDLLGFEQPVHAGPVQAGARKHDLAADQRAGIRQAPGVGVEHRHHRHDHVSGRQVHGVGQAGRIGVQNGRAMRVDHALGVAGRARGVAQRRGRGLVELGPLVVVGVAVDQVLVAQQLERRGLRHVRLVGHRDPPAHALAMRRDALDQLQEGQVEEYVLVLGVIDDVDDLLREQARIDGVTDGAAARGGVVDLEVAEAVPGERADAVGRSHPEGAQRVGKLARAPVRVPVGVAVDAAFDQARDDLGVPMIALGMTDQR